MGRDIWLIRLFRIQAHISHTWRFIRGRQPPQHPTRRLVLSSSWSGIWCRQPVCFLSMAPFIIWDISITQKTFPIRSDAWQGGSLTVRGYASRHSRSSLLQHGLLSIPLRSLLGRGWAPCGAVYFFFGVSLHHRGGGGGQLGRRYD